MRPSSHPYAWRGSPMEEQTDPCSQEVLTVLLSLATGSALHPHFYSQPLMCYTLFFLAYYYYPPLTQHKLVRKSNHNIWLVM